MVVMLVAESPHLLTSTDGGVAGNDVGSQAALLALKKQLQGLGSLGSWDGHDGHGRTLGMAWWDVGKKMEGFEADLHEKNRI